jgi:hypothetical protein
VLLSRNWQLHEMVHYGKINVNACGDRQPLIVKPLSLQIFKTMNLLKSVVIIRSYFVCEHNKVQLQTEFKVCGILAGLLIFNAIVWN